MLDTRPDSTLVLCPKAVVDVWPDQIEKWAGGSFRVFAPTKGGTKDKLKKMREWYTNGIGRSPTPSVVVLNYDAAWRGDLGDAIKQHPWNLIVYDESQRIKSPGGKASGFATGLRKKNPDATCVGLSGTPMPHSRLDIFAQYRALDPNVFGSSFVRFRGRYAIMGGHAVNGRPVQVVGWQNEEEFHEKLHSRAMFVRKEDVLDLPPFVHEVRSVEMPPAARAAYRRLERELITEWEGGHITAANAMVKATRLQQMASGHAPLEDGGVKLLHDAKRRALVALLDDIGDQPVVVATRFKASAEVVRDVCESYGPLRRNLDEITGDRNTVGAKWVPVANVKGASGWPDKSDGVCLVNYQSGGVGIDLTAASYVIKYDTTFNGGDNEQFDARTHRPGQGRSVTYVWLLARDTIDPKVRLALGARRTSALAMMRDVLAR